MLLICYWPSQRLISGDLQIPVMRIRPDGSALGADLTEILVAEGHSEDALAQTSETRRRSATAKLISSLSDLSDLWDL